MIIKVNVSAGVATPSSMLQASGYQIPPQNLYSGGWGYDPTTSSQLGMSHYDNFLSGIAMLLVLKLLVMFTFTSWSCLLYLIVYNVLRQQILENRISEINFMQLAIDSKSEPNMPQIVVNIFCRIYPTFWYAATSPVSVQWGWWIPTTIYPTTIYPTTIYPTSPARYNSFMIISPLSPIPIRSGHVISSGVSNSESASQSIFVNMHIICSYCVEVFTNDFDSVVQKGSSASHKLFPNIINCV